MNEHEEHMIDQTSFQEAQMAGTQQPVEIPIEKQAVSTTVAEKKKFPTLLILAIVGVVLSLIMMIIAAANMKKAPGVVLNPSPSPSATPSENDTWKKIFEDISKDAKAADPAISDYPFPPVSFDLSIQTKKSR